MQGNHKLSEMGQWIASPADLAFELRSRIFEYQKDAATHLGISRSMVSKYEAGKNTPPMGYLAVLAMRVADLESDDTAEGAAHDGTNPCVTGYKGALVQLLNDVRARFPGRYPGLPRIRDWDALCRIAAEYADQSRRRQTRALPGNIPEVEEQLDEADHAEGDRSRADNTRGLTSPTEASAWLGSAGENRKIVIHLRAAGPGPIQMHTLRECDCGLVLYQPLPGHEPNGSSSQAASTVILEISTKVVFRPTG